MRTIRLIGIFAICCVLFNGCYSGHMIDTQDLIDYEKSRILSLEMMSGEMIELKSDEIILSKQDKNVIQLYFNDGSSRKFNIEDIWSIRIKQFETEETIFNSGDWVFVTLPLIWIILFGS